MDGQHILRETGPVEMAEHATLIPAGVGYQLTSVSVGPAGEAIALWSAPGGTRVVTYAPHLTAEIDLRGLEIPKYPMLQPLPGDRTLIVGSRCQWRPEGPERNALVVDGDGQVVAEGTLGDGIEEVLTTPSGQIWAGYFDEGVFGNNGWGEPDAPAPVGAPGIVRFAPDLGVAWTYPRPPEGDWIADAYALNVDGETAWSCYYTDFPVARVEAGAVTRWPGGAPGTKALIVDGERCALIGGYGTDRDRYVTGSLTPGGFVPDAVGVLTLPGGAELGRRRWVGRGAELHTFVEDRWYKVSVADLPGQSG